MLEKIKLTLLLKRDPSKISWSKYNVDIVFECTGKFNSKEDTKVHLKSNVAKKVLISAPAKNVDATIVMGVNEEILSKTIR